MAIEERSAPLLKAALKRCHACPGDHALHEAARQANVPAMRLLLQSRAEPNARCLYLERGCEFPLQLVASSANFLVASERCEAASLLLRAGARPSPPRRDLEANSPLHDSARCGNLGVVKVLIEHLADPNAKNVFGETPLRLALQLGTNVCDFDPAGSSRLEIVEVLLNAGASPLAADGQALFLEGSAAADVELQCLLSRWVAWWRCRLLAWVYSRGRSLDAERPHYISMLLPEVLKHVAVFL